MTRDTLPKLSRRNVLRIGLAGGIVAGGAVIYEHTKDVGTDKWLRWMLRRQVNRVMPATRVGLQAALSYEVDLMPALDALWHNAGAPDLQGANVVIKPNLVDYIQGRPCFTAPQVVSALVRYLRDIVRAKSVVIAEGMTFRRDPQSILINTGYRDLLEQQHIEFVDLNYDDLVTVPLRGGYTKLDRLFVARTIAEADALISVPKLKTHHWTQVSGSIKNLFGIVPGIKYGFPKNTLHIQGINQFLAELLDSLPTPKRFAVVDGIVGLQGDGPLFGTAVNSGALIAGRDFLAVDATAARLMGFDPAQLDVLAFMAWAGLGQIDSGKINVQGAELASLQQTYQPAPHV